METKYYKSNELDFNSISSNTISSNILDGDLFSFPTDTVYGLACIYDKQESIKNLYKIKGRVETKPLVLYLKSVSEISLYTSDCPIFYYDFLNEFLPGCLTVILKRGDKLPDIINPELDTIGIRIVDNKFLMKLLETLGKPILGTSANISNENIIKNAKEIYNTFNKKISYVFEDNTLETNNSQKESTIIKLEDNNISLIREGKIDYQTIKNRFNKYL